MNRHRYLKILAALAALAWAGGVGLAADVPGHISYQGMLQDGGTPYTGEADFKFALVDSLTGDYIWTNDGQGPPSAAVRIPVQDGVFSVLLGAPPMEPIGISRIADFTQNQALRIWVEIGSHGEVLLGNLPLSSVLFAHQAELARASAGDFAAAGEIWSKSGGFKFPDGTVQETAATSGGGDCLWSTGAGGRIYYNAGNVGIGNTNPARNLQIGDINDSVSYLRLASSSTLGFSGLEFWDGEGNFSGMLQYAHNDDYMRFYTRSPAGAHERMRITSTGNVGIGLINPTARLHVNGTARMNGFQLGASATEGHVLTTDASGVGTWQPVPTGGDGDCFWSAGTSGRIYYNGGNIGIGTDQPSRLLSVQRSLASNINPMAIFQTTGTNSVASVRFQNADDNHFNLGITGGSHLALGYNENIGLAGDVLRITPEGNVGLGRLSPAAKLDVNGSVRMTGLQLGTSATEGYVLTANANGVGTWQAPTGGGDESPWVQSGNNIYYDDGHVGIGTSAPSYPLHAVTDSQNRSAHFVNSRVSAEASYGTFSSANGAVGGALGSMHYGVRGEASNAYSNYGIFGSASNGTTNYGVYGSATSVGGTNNYGVYGTAAHGTNNYAGYFNGRGYFSDNVGIGVTNPAHSLTVSTTTRNRAGSFTNSNPSHEYTQYGIYSTANGNAQSLPGTIHYGVYATASKADWNIGLYAAASEGNLNYAGYFFGNTHVTGTLSKGAGSFKIDHPLDPANKYLSHSFVESPDMMNIYNGNVVTDGSGRATIELPDWFEALNRDFRYQLTVIDETDSDEFVQTKIIRGVKNGSFAIRTSAPNVEVSWQVTGIRQDAYANAHRIPVEEDKPSQERGTYLHPEALGLPANLQVDRVREARIENHR